MAYKVVLSNRFSQKLVKTFTYLESNFSLEVTRRLVGKMDNKILLLVHYPGIGISSSKIPGIFKISISRNNKLYYRVKGKNIVLLDLFATKNNPGE
jgi:plasmid stabilization system protein ParE